MQIKREIYLEKIRPYYNIDLIKVLTGIRRCGKSILLKQIMEELIDTGIEKSNIIYLNFEDFEFDEINNAKKLNDYLKTLMVLESKYYLFFDEIQHVDEFEKILASLKATKNCSIFVTGSNSKLLSGDLATLLVGRTVEFKIFPFCFQEVVDYYKINSKNIDENLIYDYIKYGGMPQRFELSKDEEIINYLKDHYNGICEKDIFKKNSLIEKYKFNTIASYILANAGREFNAENIVSYFNTNNENNKKSIEKKTIYNYLEKMEKAYLISRVKRFNIVGKEELKTKEKQYAIDMGLRIINTNLIDYDDTFFLENIIYNELLVRGYEVFTGKTKKGYHLPTLLETLKLVKGRILIDIEVKEPGYEEQMSKEIYSVLSNDEFFIRSFSDEALIAFKKINKDIKVILLTGLSKPKPFLKTRFSEVYPKRRLMKCQAFAVSPYYKEMVWGYTKRVHKLGYKILPWTVNTTDEMKEIINDVDGIVTNYPDKLIEVINENVK